MDRLHREKIEHVWEIPCMEGEVVVLLGRGDPVW